MKNKLPTTEQLATLTAQLVASGIVTKLNQHKQMFSAALDYWRGCEAFLQQRRKMEAQASTALANRPAEFGAAYESVPQPAKFPAPFPWLLASLFDGERERLRDYIQYCQSCGNWPSGETDSFIAPLLGGVEDVEAFQHLTRHWHAWRQVRNKSAQGEAEKQPQPSKAKKSPVARNAAKKKKRSTR